jgi:hypothetical protein
MPPVLPFLPLIFEGISAAAGASELGLGISNAVSGPPKPPPVTTIPGSPETVVTSNPGAQLPGGVASQIMQGGAGSTSPVLGNITAPTLSPPPSSALAGVLGAGGVGGASPTGGGRSAAPPTEIGGNINQDVPPWLPSATNPVIGAPGTPSGAF